MLTSLHTASSMRRVRIRNGRIAGIDQLEARKSHLIHIRARDGVLDVTRPRDATGDPRGADASPLTLGVVEVVTSLQALFERGLAGYVVDGGCDVGSRRGIVT